MAPSGTAMSSSTSVVVSAATASTARSSQTELRAGSVSMRMNSRPTTADSDGATKVDRRFHPSQYGHTYCAPVPSWASWVMPTEAT